MKKKSSVFLLSFFLLSLVGQWIYAQEALAQEEKSFLWKVRNGRTTVYLLGSLHFLKKENYPLNSKIENAFEEADTLIVEANIQDKSKIDVETITERALYLGKDSLKDHLSKETYELIKDRAHKLGIPLEVMNKLRPWFLAISLFGLELKKKGVEARYGVDNYFLAKARQKKILELESVDYQVQLLSSFSDWEQESMFSSTLSELKTAEQEFDQLVKVWKAGDTKTLEWIITKDVKKDPKLLPAYQKLLLDRNQSMVSHLDFYLRTNGTYFVVVGAGHLVGEKGIVGLLKEKGYRVEQF